MRIQRWMWIVAVVATAAVALTSCQLHGKPHVARRAAAGAAPVVRAAAASHALAADTMERANVIAPGIVEPWGAQVDLSAQEPGWLATLAVHEGDVVQAGQPLARLEDESQRRALELARAELAEADANRARVERGATPEEIQQAQSDLVAATARRDFAVAAAGRASRLRDSGALPEAEKERTDADAAAQTAMARRAEARLQELKRGATREDLRAARAAAEAARARVLVAEAALARRTVIAPSAGTILLSRYHAGEYYAPGAGPLFVLGDMSRLQVRLEVDEIDALDVHAGASCALYSDEEALVARGVVVRLAPRMGRRSLPLESPTARADVRVREVFVEVAATATLVPGQRVWGNTPRIRRIAT